MGTFGSMADRDDGAGGGGGGRRRGTGGGGGTGMGGRAGPMESGGRGVGLGGGFRKAREVDEFEVREDLVAWKLPGTSALS